MATMARSGNLVARTIRLENPAAPVKYQGVVNSIQEDKSFGFIERADVVREVSFGFSNCFLGIKVTYKITGFFSKILHKSPILDEVTQPFRLF